MKSFEIFYAQEMNAYMFAKECPESLTRETVHETHAYLKTTEAEDLSDLFYKMQSEVWSPNGEARNVIQALGLSHTSMSVGDIAVDLETDIAHLCMPMGWKEVPRNDQTISANKSKKGTSR